MDKHRQLRIINDLLDQCGDCPKRLIAGKPDTICGRCKLYSKIRAEGKKLDRERSTAKPGTRLSLTVPEYWEIHNNGQSDEEIAFMKDVSPNTINMWKSRNGIHTTRIRRTVNLTVDEYKRLRKQGLTVRQVCQRAGSTREVFTRWRKENGLTGDSERGIKHATDEQVLQALMDHRSYWWISRYLRCDHKRAKRLAKEHGIAK